MLKQKYKMRRPIIDLAFIVFAAVVSPLVAYAQNATVETHQFTSRVFNNTRTIRVLLPPGYHAADSAKTKYPVLYLNDGIMVFHAFHLEEILPDLIRTKKIRPVIIVGIDNGGSTDKTKEAGKDRANEYLPYPDVGFPPDSLYEPETPSPLGKLQPKFLDEVRSLIEKTYRIEKGPKSTGIGGFSYGGVAALYTAIKQPKVFGKLLLESSPLWIGKDRQLLTEAMAVHKWPGRVYTGLGTNESDEEKVNREGIVERDSLVAAIGKNAPRTLLKVVLEEGAKHEPSAWSKRFPAALQFLFGPEAETWTREGKGK